MAVRLYQGESARACDDGHTMPGPFGHAENGVALECATSFETAWVIGSFCHKPFSFRTSYV